MSERTCSVEGCEGVKPKLKRGMCGKHYQRLTRLGTLELPQRVYRMCDGPQCSRRAGDSGLCRSHYQQRHLGKDLTPLLVAAKDLGRPALCIFPDCGRPHKARGLCKAHNDQVKKAQALRPVQDRTPGLMCSEAGCEREAIARGLCAKDLVYSYEVVKRYGLTLDQYDALYQSQGGVCAICGRVNSNGYRLSIDHDHACCAGKSCGKCVRGLLCGKCNLTLGNADDEAERLRKAAEYLDRWNTRGAVRSG